MPRGRPSSRGMSLSGIREVWSATRTSQTLRRPLAIDFFGTLKTALEAERNAILEHLSARINLPEAGPWQIYLEWEDDRNRLRESRKRSQVDSVAKSRSATILFECKFGETDGGACSQTLLVRGGLHAGMKQCNGNYEMQENPVNGTSARCALTGKGIKYWELIPSVFRLVHRPVSSL